MTEVQQLNRYTNDYTSSSTRSSSNLCSLSSNDKFSFQGIELTPKTHLNQFKCQECQNAPNQRTVDYVTASELHAKLLRARNLNSDVDFILVDTRDCAAYCSRHIVTSINFNCHSKIMARRAVKLWSDMFSESNQCPAPRPIQRTTSMLDTTTASKSNSVVHTLHSVKSFCAGCTSMDYGQSAPLGQRFSSVIVYDEDGEQFSADFQGVPTNAIPPLHLFVNHLMAHSNNVLFLQGGLKAFTKLPYSPEEFLDFGPDLAPSIASKQEHPLSGCRPSPSSGLEPRVNCLSVSSAADSRHEDTVKRQKVGPDPFQDSTKKTQRTKPKLQLSATFPPRSGPMPPRLMLPHMLIKTPEAEPNHSSYKSCGSGGDIFGAVISKILPNLYIGNARDAQDKNLLEELKITHILNVTDSVPNGWENKFIYKRLPAVDNDRQNLRPQFDYAFNFINNAITEGGTVLVHCQAGVSRSVTIVIAYMLRQDVNLKLMDALEKVQEVRPIAGPNLNFMGQLQAYQRELKARSLDNPPVSTSDGSTAGSAVASAFQRGHSRNGSNGSLCRSGSHDSLKDMYAMERAATVTNDSPAPLMSPCSSGSSEDACTPN